MIDDCARAGETFRPGEDDPASARHRVTSVELFRGARELVIEHEGRTYQLRITRNGKLILTA